MENILNLGIKKQVYKTINIILLILMGGLSIVFSPVFAEVRTKETAYPTYVLKYEMLVDGEKIGLIESTRKKQQKGDELLTVIDGKLDIRIESFFGDYSLSFSEEIKLGTKGTFQYFARYTEDSDRGVIKAKNQGNIINVELKHNKEVHSMQIKKKDFDTTSEEVSGYFLSKVVDELTVRVLDLDEFIVERVVFKAHGKEELNIAGKTFLCRVITFESKDKKGKQWVTQDKTGAWIVKEQGVDNGDKYLISLTDIFITKK